MPPKKRLTSLNYLLIVESSSKCSKIESYLGDRYRCIASNGHIRSIEGLQSIDVKKDYAVTYVVDPDKKAHVDKMRVIIAEYPKENVIIASDHDREGEAIAWHLCEVFDLPVATTRRIVFHEITKPAILAAVANPGKIDMNLIKAQQARQVLDMIVGFRISPVLWKHLGSSNSLSAGRCQTPALRLVYENELEARKTLATGAVKHRVQASFFESHNILFELDRTFSSYTEVEAFLEASKTHKHMLEIGKSRVSVRSPPKPFNTATMLQSASNLFGMGAKDAMACCQSLYQMGHITYMRTESRKYSPVFTEIAAKYIAETWTKEHVNAELETVEGSESGSKEPDSEPSRLVPKGPIESDPEGPLAHEAIRVTNIHMRDFAIISTASDKSSGSLERMYKMIWQNTVQSCMSNATFNCLPLSVSSPISEGNYKHTIETVKFAGFLDAKDKGCKASDGCNNLNTTHKGKTKDIDMSKVAASIVLQHNSTKGAPIPYNHIETIIGFTAHHSRFTEASLIDKLDELGIGRPSTFSMLTDVIQTRKYVEKTDVPGVKHECREYCLKNDSITHKTVDKMMGAEHKKLVIDPIGITVIEFLLQHFAEFFSYNYTNMMEKRLDAVAAGKEQWHQVCADCDKEIGKLVRALESVGKRTYKVGDDYVLFFHKNGMLLRSVQGPEGTDGKVQRTDGSEGTLDKGTTKGPDTKCTFKGIRRGVKVDMAKLERGEYTLADLAEIDEIVLGVIEDGECLVTLKPGKYGYYLEFDGKRISVDKELKALGKTAQTVTLADLEHLLKEESKDSKEPFSNSFRILTPEISVRTSKFGPYVFYQTTNAKGTKPKFYDLKKFEGDCWTCDREEMLVWLKTTHKVKITGI
jgi:DNA topoisomerase-1